MKICITFKTPDAVDYALEDAFPKQKANYETDSWEPLSEEEEDERTAKLEEVKEFLNHYIENGEVVTLKFDTEKETAIVLKANTTHE